ncbi:hypothetical protein [Candidatus Viadribacter manganicus]|nr:hypothetical protein [Candidatus Viadribacter manganicus]
MNDYVTTLPRTPSYAAPPSADAPFEQRESWCDAYVSRLIPAAPEIVSPEDIGQTHRFEVEFNACKLDPQEYRRQTLEETERIPESFSDPLPREEKAESNGRADGGERQSQ